MVKQELFQLIFKNLNIIVQKISFTWDQNLIYNELSMLLAINSVQIKKNTMSKDRKVIANILITSRHLVDEIFIFNV